MLYSTIADVYEKIERTTKRLEMTRYLVDLFKQTPKEIVDKVVYLTIGELYPPYVGIELGIAEKLAIRAIANSAGVSEREVQNVFRDVGDLGKTAEMLLEKRKQVTLFHQPLTVEHVYETLEKIAHATGEGAQDIKIRNLSGLLNNASPKEARYLVRMVTGRLRLGIADMTVLDALAIAFGGGKEFREEVERAYNLSSDLGYVAKVIAEQGLEGIRNFRVTVGRPIRPMLAERLTSPQEILEKVGGKAIVEFKYDGLRIQAHLTPDQAWLFSRRLENLTNQFPDVVEGLREALKCKEAIVEGECVAIDPNTGEMLPFQMVAHRRGRKYGIEEMVEEIPVTVFLFDVLYVDGQDFTVRPFLERRKALEEIVEPTERIRLSEYAIVNDPEVLDDFMHKAVESGCEGVMVKSISGDAIYQAGARGWLWIKYKRDYRSEMADTVDLVAVGAFMGRGKRGGTYGALLMAAYDKETDTFKTVCKLGTGFDDETLAALPKIFEPYKIDHKHPRVDSKIEADVWFVPAKVLEVIGAELTISPSHTCALDVIRKGSGIAIRFPRFTGRWRDDKAPEDATTVQEIVEMYRSQLKRVEE